MIEGLLPRMSRLAGLLAATDGSEYSEGTLAVAIALAEATGARLTVATMVPLSEDLERVGTQDLLAEQDALAQRHLDEARARASAAGVACETEIRHGEAPHAEIVAAAEEREADLIVMGRRGRRGLAKLMVGDATARVIAASPCPVLVVPRAAGLWRRRVLLATDGSAHSEAAAAAAIAAAALASLPLGVVPAAGHGEAQKAQQAVDKVRAVAAARGLGVDARVEAGRPQEVVPHVAAEQGADLLVVGSHSRGGLLNLLLGSVSRA